MEEMTTGVSTGWKRVQKSWGSARISYTKYQKDHTEMVITLGELPTGTSHLGQQNDDKRAEVWVFPQMSAEVGSSGKRVGI